MDNQQTWASTEQEKHSLLCFKTIAGHALGIESTSVQSVQPDQNVHSCPWGDEWITGMVISQNMALPLIDPDKYIQHFLPVLVQNQQEGEAQNTQFASKAALLICKNGDQEFAIKCTDVYMNAVMHVDQAQIEHKSEEGFCTHALMNGQSVYEVDFSHFMDRMVRFDDNDEADYAGDAESDADAQTEGQIAAGHKKDKMVMIRSGVGFFALRGEDVLSTESHYSVLEPPVKMPDWVLFLAGLGNGMIVPVTRPRSSVMQLSEKEELATGFEQFKVTKGGESAFPIVVVSDEDRAISIAVHSCQLITCDELLNTGGGFVCISDENHYPVIDVPALLARANEEYILPQPMALEPEVQHHTFLKIRLGKCYYIIDLRHVLRIVPFDSLAEYSGAIDDFSTMFEGQFVGVISIHGNVAVPVFDIGAQYSNMIDRTTYRDELKDESLVEAQVKKEIALKANSSRYILVIGDEIQSGLSFIVDDIDGLVKAFKIDVQPVSTPLKLLSGVLRNRDESLMYVMEGLSKSVR